MARLGRMDMFEEESGEGLAYRSPKAETAEGEWECTICGYVREGRRPPKVCPDCGADADEFEFWEYGDEDWDDEDYE